MALALGKLNFSCAVIGLTFINRACRQRIGTPKFRGSGCQFPQSQCHPSPRTGIALGTRLGLSRIFKARELPAEVQGSNPNWGGTCAQAKFLHIVLTLSVLLIDFYLNTFESNMFICITTKCRNLLTSTINKPFLKLLHITIQILFYLKRLCKISLDFPFSQQRYETLKYQHEIKMTSCTWEQYSIVDMY